MTLCGKPPKEAVDMIQLDQVTKSYHPDLPPAVSELSLTVEKGEFVAVIGESGSGKTTALKLINRLENPTSGMITVDGRDVGETDPVELRRNIGYVFQGIGLFPHYSVSENIGVVPRLLGWSEERVSDRVDETLELVGLEPHDYADRMPDELSGGQQQRIGVARALAAEPDVVLMDEPFGALDPITRASLQDQFHHIQKRMGLTVVMVTHDMTEALLLADRIAVMKDGELLQAASPKTLLTEPEHPYVRELVQMPKDRADRLEAMMAEEDAAETPGPGDAAP
jgi:osmoprotectant transport system ATP-binding protein